MLQSHHPAWHKEATVSLQKFSTNDEYQCIVRVDDARNLIYVFDIKTNALWQFSENGAFIRKLSLDDLKIKPQVPVKNRAVRTMDFWPVDGGRVVIAEGNTASLYIIDLNGTIHRRIRLENSPTGVTRLPSGNFLVFDEDFERAHLKLVDASGRTIHSIAIDNIRKSGQVPSKPTYLVIDDQHLAVYARRRHEIVKCTIVDSSIHTVRIKLPDPKRPILRLGFNPTTNRLWFVLDANQANPTYFEIARVTHRLEQQKYDQTKLTSPWFYYASKYYVLEGGQLTRYGYQ
jgi:hypothetical protein